MPNPILRRRILSASENPILFRYSAGDSLALATFTRASTATYRDVAGVLQAASSGVARDNHYALDPVSGLYKRTLLLEGQRTNLFLRSEELDNAAWVKNNFAVTANAGAAPDGTTTADRVLKTNPTPAIYEALTLTAASYTVSAWVKRNTGSNQTFRLFGQDSIISSDFTATSTWQQFSFTYTAAAALAAHGLTRDVADSVLDILVWGMQVELGSFPSSYIPTVASTVSRAADSLSFPFTAVPQEMTMFARGVDAGEGINGRILEIGGGGANRFLVYTANGPVAFFQNTASVQSSITPLSSVGQSVEFRATLSSAGTTRIHRSLNAAAEVSGTESATLAMPSSWSVPTIEVGIGGGINTNFAFRELVIAKGIRDLAYFRSRIAP